MSLGDKLKVTIDELDNAKVSQHGSDLTEIRRRKKSRQEWVTATYDNIVQDIEGNKVPKIRVTIDEDQAWIKKATQGKAPFQDVWNEFQATLGKEKLAVVVTVSMKNGEPLTEITVTPSVNKINYRGKPEEKYGGLNDVATFHNE
jgi:hypothetical protein